MDSYSVIGVASLSSSEVSGGSSQSLQQEQPYSSAEKVLLYGLLPFTLGFVVFTIYNQWVKRPETIKNLRGFFHFICVCMFIEYTLLIDEMVNIRPTSYNEVMSLDQHDCNAAGFMRVLLEALIIMALLIYIKVIKKTLVSETTKDMRKIFACYFILAGLFIIGLTTTASMTVGYGLQTNLLCGPDTSQNNLRIEILTLWPIAFVPYLIWKACTITRDVPYFIYHSLQYYANLTNIFVVMYTIKLIVQLAFRMHTITLVDENIQADPQQQMETLNKIYQSRTAVVYLFNLHFVIILGLVAFKQKTIESFFQKLSFRKSSKSKRQSTDTKSDTALGAKEKSFNLPLLDNDQSSLQNIVDEEMEDENFKRLYSADVLRRQTTLRLKSNFHTINCLLMSICQTFTQHIADYSKREDQASMIDDVASMTHESKSVTFSPYEFTLNNPKKVIYTTADDDSNQIEVIEMAPRIFHELRKKFNVSEAALMKSFEPSRNVQAIHNFSTGSGQSCSFFLFTDDKVFVMKTLKPEEESLLLNQTDGILGEYYQHMMKYGDNSLLSKFFGVFRVHDSMSEEPISIVIMDSLIGKEFPSIKRLYDIKGSTFGRETELTKEEIEKGSGLKTLKDLNFQGIDITEEQKRQLIKQLQIDSEFLAKLGLIDYSLLLTEIENEKTNNNIFSNSELAIQKQLICSTQNKQVQKNMSLAAQDGRIFLAKKVMVQETPLFKQQVFNFDHIKGDSSNDTESLVTSFFSNENVEYMENDAEMQFNKKELQPEIKELKNKTLTPQNRRLMKSQVHNNSSQYIESSGSGTKILRKRQEFGHKLDNTDFTKHYKMGVIDFLTKHTFAKTLETNVKSFLYGVNANVISAQDPQVYQERFVSFLDDKMLIKQTDGNINLSSDQISLEKNNLS